MSLKPTDEQAAVVAAFTTGDALVVEAGAGAGKTSTLKLCAAATPRRRGLYVAYNRALRDEAKASFPSTVRASTTHGLAYLPVAVQFERAGRPINGPRQTGRQVAEILRINEPTRITDDRAPLAPAQLARLAIQTVARFCMSGSEELEPWHVPTQPGMEDRPVRADLRRAVLPHAQRAWADLCSTGGRLRLIHNHYLKMYQLRHPRLRGDFVLVDEAQDLNPCVVALMAEQTHMQVVYVGDRCQAINGWNGAVDAMRDAPGRRLYLSQSFRFGPAIADEANKWLAVLRAELRLRGFDDIPSRIERLGRADAILCRSNAEAVSQAAFEAAGGRRTAIVGGGDDIRSLAEAAVDLQAGQGTGHPELCAFQSWAEVEGYVAQDAAGSDLKVAVSLINSYGPEGVLEILGGLVDEKSAEVVVSTAHKSKGREWGTVVIADDFREPRPNEDSPQPVVPREDAMLAYVAVTRAQRVLDRSGLAWVDNWLPSAPALAPSSWLAAAVREHPEAVLDDQSDPYGLDGVGADYRIDPAEGIAAVAAVTPTWAPAAVPPPAPRRSCPDCRHTTMAHHRGSGRPPKCSVCGCTRVSLLVGAAA
ncbi:UvrD-helicase domain-containing protein [Actinoplanes sp. CA-252034]|uniref:UvrD-helicase domain-containing protein n=1 Tax=Actinoplanes sp. CA-252034 TaxID=3239906 RepID=UPI003D969ED8